MQLHKLCIVICFHCIKNTYFCFFGIFICWIRLFFIRILCTVSMYFSRRKLISQCTSSNDVLSRNPFSFTKKEKLPIKYYSGLCVKCIWILYQNNRITMFYCSTMNFNYYIIMCTNYTCVLNFYYGFKNYISNRYLLLILSNWTLSIIS